MGLAGMPICDIDPYYNDKLTFMVVSRGGSMYRCVLTLTDNRFRRILYVVKFLSIFHPL